MESQEKKWANRVKAILQLKISEINENYRYGKISDADQIRLETFKNLLEIIDTLIIEEE